MPAVKTRASNPPGGIIANIGVHGAKVDLHLERLWDLTPPKSKSRGR
jgi:hypothetical protein